MEAGEPAENPAHTVRTCKLSHTKGPRAGIEPGAVLTSASLSNLKRLTEAKSPKGVAGAETGPGRVGNKQVGPEEPAGVMRIAQEKPGNEQWEWKTVNELISFRNQLITFFDSSNFSLSENFVQ